MWWVVLLPYRWSKCQKSSWSYTLGQTGDHEANSGRHKWYRKIKWHTIVSRINSTNRHLQMLVSANLVRQGNGFVTVVESWI